MKFLEELAARRRFGMKPGLDAIRGTCAALGDPQKSFKAIHVAGTNGKGAVCAMLDAALRANGLRVGRYTSPHLVKLNERFFLDGAPIGDDALSAAAEKVAKIAPDDLTFFEALTAVAFLVYADAKVDYAVLETGLGGRLDATNVCVPELCVITRIGLDHCDWLGDTVEKIASEKAGIIKPHVPVVLGENLPEVRAVVEARAKEVGAPFFYAPDVASAADVPRDFPLGGTFNRENAVTALAALKVLGKGDASGFADVVWPGRFQRVENFIIDGAHNPPAAHALAEALRELHLSEPLALIAGFCGDKDVGDVLSILAPFVKKGYAVRTNNPRSLSAEETAEKMRAAGIDAVAAPSLAAAIGSASSAPRALICGSLFLAGEALVELGAYPWPNPRFDAAELLRGAAGSGRSMSGTNGRSTAAS
ncbi:MAG: bifunctional folylpolyglutamate synthase/dihydrofolate synthase [Kiritimatiellae bacterium]|nr:bifunctional folylpolyglutamate synthase/dihydrofolate synthase [Kiritimatiellia bacterium]